MSAVVVMAIFLVAGLVVDGGAQVRAHRQAEVSAAIAVRAGSDASAARRLLGEDGTGEALAAARGVLAAEGVEGQASMSEGVLSVTTAISAETTFLSLLGIGSLPTEGSASAELQEA